MKTNERRFQVNVYYETCEGFKGADTIRTETAQAAAQFAINYAADKTERKVTEVIIKDWDACKTYRSNDADIEALTTKTTVTTKIATNGVKLYYVDGKRVGKAAAMEIAANLDRQIMSGLFEQTNTDNITKFEEGKTYYRIWDEDTGRPHMSHFTITKRTAKTVVLKNGGRCRIFVNDNGVEVFKAGYGTYVYADNLCTVEAEKRQANSDAAWNKMEADAQRRMLELKAAEAERYEIMSTPLTTQDALEVAVRAEIQNANNEIEPATTELSDEEIAEIKRRSQINAIKSRIATYERAIERQYDQELENRLIEAKAQLAEIEPDITPQVDPIIQERDTARNEYEEINQVRRLIEKDCERYERLRDRCKPNSPKHKEYKQLLADFDPIIRAFGDKFAAAQNRYNDSLTLRTDEEKAATQKAIDEYNADLDARGIKYFATVYYYPNGVEGEDMENFFKECTSLDEANAFVSQEEHDGVYVGGIYDAGWQITDRNHNLIADHITGIKEEQPMTTKPVNTLATGVAKYQAEFERARQISVRAGSSFYNVNGGETIHFNYGEVRAIFSGQSGHSDHYKAEIIFKNGKKHFRYDGISVSRTAFLKIITDARAETAIKDQAEFYADKIKRDAQPSNEKVFDLLPTLDQLNDVDDMPLDEYADFNRDLALLDSLDISLVENIIKNLDADPNPKLAKYTVSIQFKHRDQKGELPQTGVAVSSTDFNRAEKILANLKVALAGLPIEFIEEPRIEIFDDDVVDFIPVYYAAELDGSEEDNDCDNIFNLLPNLDELNDLSETDPYFMDDDAEYTERDARFNYGERYAAALTEKLRQYDPTVKITYDIDDDDEDVYYLKFDGIYDTHYALSGIESAFHRLKKDIAEEEFMKNVDGTLDDKIAALKRKQVRNSLNRAIKQCIRNRIGYLKSHNSKMEKYEYELMHLLQGARRELEVA